MICHIELYKIIAGKVLCFVLVCESSSAIPPLSSVPGRISVGRCNFPGCLWEIKRELLTSKCLALEVSVSFFQEASMLFVNTDIPIKHKEAAWCLNRK